MNREVSAATSFILLLVMTSKTTLSRTRAAVACSRGPGTASGCSSSSSIGRRRRRWCRMAAAAARFVCHDLLLFLSFSLSLFRRAMVMRLVLRCYSVRDSEAQTKHTENTSACSFLPETKKEQWQKMKRRSRRQRKSDFSFDPLFFLTKKINPFAPTDVFFLVPPSPKHTHTNRERETHKRSAQYRTFLFDREEADTK